MSTLVAEHKINIEEPRWDQSTYIGRCRHFFTTANPLNLFYSTAELDAAKDIVQRYRRGERLTLTEDELWKSKTIYDSAFHPDTGEKMIWFGRMSAQVPMCMFIGGSMLTFYKTTKEVIFWQWFNQSFNAVVNYTNRSGKTPISTGQIATSYVLATGGAMAAALSLNSLVKKAPPIMARFVPFSALVVANCINIPLMRQKELVEGTPVSDANGNELGNSKAAAKVGVSAVTFSRNLMAAPGFIVPAIVMNSLEKRGILRRMPWISAPLQTIICGLMYTFATPMSCALFPQKASIKVDNLEADLKERIKKLPDAPQIVYYNKGL